MPAKRKAQSTAAHNRPTIGLFSAFASMPTELELWRAMVEMGRERDVNVILFAGGHLQDRVGFQAQRNLLYELAEGAQLDGIVNFAGSVATYVGIEGLQRFCQRYRPLPMVNLSSQVVEGVPTVLVDNYTGVREIMAHLVEVHGYRRIAYLVGRQGNLEAQVRYQAYQDALAAYAIPFDEALVVQGDYSPSSGAYAVKVLFDERQVAFEALVSANDHMLMGAMPALRARNIRVPYDLAVVGFDDRPETAVLTPPLSTVRQPWYEIGRQAVELVLAQLQGVEVAREVLVPAQLIVRQSCGCMPQAVREAAVAEQFPPTLVPAPRGKLARTLAGHLKPLLLDSILLPADWATQLAEAFCADIAVAAQSTVAAQLFLPRLDAFLQQVVTGNGDIAAWHGVLSGLRRHILPYFEDKPTLMAAEDLLQQARVLLGAVEGRLEAAARLTEAQEAAALRQVGQSLITTFDVAELMRVVARELPPLGVQGCYLVAYEYAAQPMAAARLLLAYDTQGVQAIEPGGRPFPAPQLLPADVLARDVPYALVVEPLYFQQAQLGFVLFAGEPSVARLYDTLRAQLSSALQGALLVQQVEARAQQIRTASEVARAASSILDPNLLIQQVVELARERFGLYYAGLFLVDTTGEWTDEAGKWAVLRAGTGEAGRAMLEHGHKLEIGGASMIGTCVSTKLARIALDVRAETVRFDNPWLPDTRSEMALPLVARDRVIGAMTIQSTRANAFSEEDVAILEAMTSQVAIAIDNTRLLEHTRATLRQTESLYRAGQALVALERPQETLQVVVDSVVESLEAHIAFLITFDVEQRQVLDYIKSGPGVQQVLELDFEELFEGLSGWVLRERQPALLLKGAIDDRETSAMRQRRQEAQDGSIIVVPLLYREQPLGTLTAINSLEQRDFTQRDVDMMMALATQAAAALANIRLLQHTQTAMRDMEAVQRRYRQDAWREYLQTAQRLAYTLGRAAEEVPMDAVAQQEIEQTMQHQQPLVRSGRDAALIVPSVARGQVVGAIGVQDAQHARVWSEDEVSLLEAIAERMALTADNLRLIDETQQRAARERLAAEVTARMRETLDLDTILQTAVREIGEALALHDVTIRLQDEQA